MSALRRTTVVLTAAIATVTTLVVLGPAGAAATPGAEEASPTRDVYRQPFAWNSV